MPPSPKTDLLVIQARTFDASGRHPRLFLIVSSCSRDGSSIDSSQCVMNSHSLSAVESAWSAGEERAFLHHDLGAFSGLQRGERRLTNRCRGVAVPG
jgi:hypothetical protein